MKENGNKIKCTEKVNLLGKMGKDIKVYIIWEKNKVMEYLYIHNIMNIEDNGKMINRTEMDT